MKSKNNKLKRSMVLAQCFVAAAFVMEAEASGTLDASFGSSGVTYLNFQPGAVYPVGDPGTETIDGLTFQPTLELANGELVSFASRYEEVGSYTPQSTPNVWVPGHSSYIPGGGFCTYYPVFHCYGSPGHWTYVPGAYAPGTPVPKHGNITQSRMMTRMAKFNVNGAPITSVDLGGILVFSALQQSDGKLVVAGMNFSRATGAWNANKPERTAQVVLKRFNIDLTPDNTFDGDGTALPAITGSLAGMQTDGMVQLSGGKFLLLAHRVPDLGVPELARLNSNGSLDTTFGGGDGRQPLAIPNAYGAIKQADGNILIRYNDGGLQGFARVDENGNLDATFAGDGTLNTGLSFNMMDTAMMQQSDGKLLLSHGNTLVRYNQNGSTPITLSANPSVSYFTTLSQLPSGEVLSFGFQVGSNNARIAIYETNGTLNTTASLDFNAVSNPTINYNNLGLSMLQSNGRLLVSGTNASGLALLERHNAFPNTDIDSDGVLNVVDNCPVDSNANQADYDGDGVGDVCDRDRDGDGINDANDNCPLISNANQANADGDSYGDACEPDFDGDTIIDDFDNCPKKANLNQANADGDSFGDVCDPDLIDTDHDGLVNAQDNCPNAANANQLDTDHDGIGDVCDFGTNPDYDSDGILNGVDNCPGNANSNQADFNGDGYGDVCTDEDGDGLKDSQEITLGTQPLNPDTDGDTWTDGEEVNVYGTDPKSAASKPADQDGDHVIDSSDNCPSIYNATQLNTDGDSQGDVCDLDDDNDAMSDIWENQYGLNPLVNDASSDLDGDGITNLQEYTNGSNPTTRVSKKNDYVNNHIAGWIWKGQSNGVETQTQNWQLTFPLYSTNWAIPNRFFMPTFPDQANWDIVTSGDFNKDGDADIVWRHKTLASWKIWQMQGGTRVAQNSPPDFDLAHAWTVVGAGDTDKDGDDDIILNNTSTGEIMIWEMQNHAVVATHSVGTKAGYVVSRIGDFNKDGDVDLLLRQVGGDTLITWEIEASAFVAERALANTGTGYNPVCAGDFDGDGDDDIMLINSTTMVEKWFVMQNYTRTQATGSSNVGFVFLGCGDYDGDGDADMLWQRSVDDMNRVVLQQNWGATKQTVYTNPFGGVGPGNAGYGFVYRGNSN